MRQSKRTTEKGEVPLERAHLSPFFSSFHGRPTCGTTVSSKLSPFSTCGFPSWGSLFKERGSRDTKRGNCNPQLTCSYPLCSSVRPKLIRVLSSHNCGFLSHICSLLTRTRSSVELSRGLFEGARGSGEGKH